MTNFDLQKETKIWIERVIDAMNAGDYVNLNDIYGRTEKLVKGSQFDKFEPTQYYEPKKCEAGEIYNATKMFLNMVNSFEDDLAENYFIHVFDAIIQLDDAIDSVMCHAGFEYTQPVLISGLNIVKLRNSASLDAIRKIASPFKVKVVKDEPKETINRKLAVCDDCDNTLLFISITEAGETKISFRMVNHQNITPEDEASLEKIELQIESLVNLGKKN